MSRPCKLQINQRGAWRDVLTFDMDLIDVEVLQIAATNLVRFANPDGNTKLRIVIADAFQTALIHWDAKTGWRDSCPSQA
jgi:hypothetical protein